MEKLIVMGDYSGRRKEVIPGMKQCFNESITNENGELMVFCCKANELVINRAIHYQLVLDMRSLTTPNLESYH